MARTRDNAGVLSPFVGRAEPLGRLGTVYRTFAGAPGGAHRAGLVLVAGEAGIGKTALLTRFTTEVFNLGVFTDFMGKVGTLKNPPKDWKTEMVFPEAKVANN